MMWYRCESIMPGEKHDWKKYPDNKQSFFLICYHDEDKNLINPDLKVHEAILFDGKFIAKGSSIGWDKQHITHWMIIELP